MPTDVAIREVGPALPPEEWRDTYATLHPWFRGRFLGKCRPVHFFWGSFDLAVTRFARPSGAYYHPQLSEFILPYEAVRSTLSPRAARAAFLESTFDAAGEVAQDRAALDRPPSAEVD